MTLMDDTEAGTVAVDGSVDGCTGDRGRTTSAALGPCTSMTVALFARRRGWPLEAVTVRLEHSMIDAVDCQDCKTKEGLIDKIYCDVELVVHAQRRAGDAPAGHCGQMSRPSHAHEELHILPIVYGCIGSVFGAMWAGLYNLFSSLVGGLELET